MAKITKPVKIKWTYTDSRRASAQGWGLFDAGDRYDIEAMHDAVNGFANDDAALTWVIKRACKGDKTCAKGLIIAGLLDPEWLAADLTSAMDRQTVIVVGANSRRTLPCSRVPYRSNAPAAWDNDPLQFTRLLGELATVGLTKPQRKHLRDVMDLGDTEIEQLMDRAQTAWDGIKAATHV